MERDRYYITTAIDYVNQRPHLGTAYEKIGADCMARYKRLCGYDTYFLMGNDEHSTNVEREARRNDLDPLEYCKNMSVEFQSSRLYEGTEVDCFHGLTMPGDGSMVRIRTTPPGDGRKLYCQRVVNPGTESNFSQWAYTSQYNVVATAVASIGSEVSIFWTKSDREIGRIKSTNYGASWGSPEIVEYSPTVFIYGLGAAYKGNGDLAVFFADSI